MQVSGTEKGTNVVFLHTTVDDGDHFQQILSWTLNSRWQQQNELLREITESFQSNQFVSRDFVFAERRAQGIISRWNSALLRNRCVNFVKVQPKQIANWASTRRMN